MGDKSQEQLQEKFQRCTLPNEFNRQKDLCKELGEQRLAKEIECKELMAKILDLKRQDKPFDDDYAKLMQARQMRDILTNEEAQIYQQQYAMTQNFIKDIDKHIDVMEEETEFIDKARIECSKGEGEAHNKFYSQMSLQHYQNGQTNYRGQQSMGLGQHAFNKSGGPNQNALNKIMSRGRDGRYRGTLVGQDDTKQGGRPMRPVQSQGNNVNNQYLTVPGQPQGMQRVRKSNTIRQSNVSMSQTDFTQNQKGLLQGDSDMNFDGPLASQNLRGDQEDILQGQGLIDQRAGSTVNLDGIGKEFSNMNLMNNGVQDMNDMMMQPQNEDDKEICSKCMARFVEQKKNEDMMWIGCDGCGKWFHSFCMNISNTNCRRMEEAGEDWFCSEACNKNQLKNQM